MSDTAEKATSPPPPSPGERYGRYQLVEQIGKGGMAEVFRAVADGFQGFRRVFVVKRIRPEKSDSPEFIQMFCDEARISALLDHPNIVQVYDFGQIAGSYFMAMEYLHGKDLSSVLRALRAAKKAVPPEIAAHVAQQVALGLHHAHTANFPGGVPGQIVHRDVTPSNIMLMRVGGVKVLDFGIAKAAALARQADTQNGRVKGKLAYLSPEQVRAGDVDGRSDVFALGVVFWEMLTGARLFPGENEFQTMRNVLVAEVPAPSSRRGGIPTALDAVVLRCLQRDPAARYPSAQALADDLERFLADTPCPSQAVPNLLVTLFGADIPEQGGDPIQLSRVDMVALDSAAIKVPPPLPGAPPPPPGASPAASASASASAKRPPPALALLDRLRFRRHHLVAAAAAVTLAGCFAWAARSRHHRAGHPVEVAAQPQVVGTPVPFVAPPAGAARPLIEPVLVTIESTPAGADVADDDSGAILGATPVSVPLTRSTRGKTLRLLKEGYLPAVYTVIPDRPQTLRAALELNEAALAPPATRARRSASAVTTRETINPFK